MTSAAASVLSLQVGKPQTLQHEGKEWTTGLFKNPLQSSALLQRLGFVGDGQADLVNHGGPDKAVCVYSSSHYPYWQEMLGIHLPDGAFGENVTLQGRTEQDVRIGDIYRMGTAVVQVSQPRQPCYKLGYRYERTDMPVLVQNSGYTGWYFRVLEEGSVKPGDVLELTGSSSAGITVAEANRIMYQERENADAIRLLLDIPELSESWRHTLSKRLTSLQTQ